MNLVKEMSNVGYTENGMKGYKSIRPLLDLNFKVPDLRRKVDYDLFEEALKEDTNLTLKWLLYLRDIREGIGERETFRNFLKYLCNKHEYLAEKFLEVPLEEYGRYDDYIAIINEIPQKLKSKILDKISTQLNKDLETDHPSLLAKWMPSEGASSYKTKALASIMRKGLGLTNKEYRKMLTNLRKKIDIVESKMSRNEWGEIAYEKVPSKANLNYKDAFLRNDQDRREAYLESLKKGEVKINSNALFPHEIVNRYGYYINSIDDTLEEMWKSMNKPIGFTDTLVVRDGSGSMGFFTIPGTNTTALTVADALTIYCAENNQGAYKDYFMTFSAKAKVLKLKGDTLASKLNFLHEHDDPTTTNAMSIFDLLLETALENNATQEDMPKNILIISDMEYDSTCYTNTNPFKVSKNKFAEHGYKLPKLIFWNVNSRTNTIPITENEDGLILISGFSKSLMEMVMSSEMDCFEALKKILDTDRYKCVDGIFNRNCI